MGAKTWMIVIAPVNAVPALPKEAELDRAATHKLAEELFPGETLVPLDSTDLYFTNPPNEDIHIGCYKGVGKNAGHGEVAVIAAKEFGIDYPSKLQQRFIDAAQGRRMVLVAMHSVVDWLAYAVWEDGRLVRALSLSPDSGVMENIGPHLDFEAPYWDGEHSDPVESEEYAYPLPFHPLDFGGIVLRELVGFIYEGAVDDSLLEPDAVELMCFRRSGVATPKQPVAAIEPRAKPWWKLWG